MKAMIMLSCAAMVLRARDDEGGGGALTKALPELEFQQRVLGAQQKNAQVANELTLKVDNLDKETKKALEEFTAAKNKFEDVETLHKSFNKLTLQMNREKRLAMGSSSVERVSSDPLMRASLNAAIRRFSSTNGDLNQVAEAVAKSVGEDTSPGSTLLVPQLLHEIYSTLASYGKWATLGVRPMGTKLVNMPVETTRPIAYCLTAEGATIAEDTAKAGTSVLLTAVPIAVIMSLSYQLLQDGEFDLAAMVLNDFYEAFNYRADYMMFQGNGTNDATNGGVTGLFNAGTASVAATGHTSIATYSFEDFTRCMLTVDEGVLDRETRWWGHPFSLIQALSVKDANGRPIFLTALEAPTPNALGSILGSPVTTVNAAPKPIGVSASTASFAFGDPQGYVVGTRQDFNFDYSDHAKWAQLQRSFRAFGRMGGQCRRAQAFSILTSAGS